MKSIKSLLLADNIFFIASTLDHIYIRKLDSIQFWVSIYMKNLKSEYKNNLCAALEDDYTPLLFNKWKLRVA